MTKYIVGNWKSHKNVAEVKEWVTGFKSRHTFANFPAGLQVVLCPSFVHLSLLHTLEPELTLGAQTLSAYPNGSYTGAISAFMVKDFVKYAILGHVERRKYFGETDVIVGNQAIQAIENGITPIIAVEKQNWSAQLSQLSDAQLKKTLVMYEPAEAISSASDGHPADLADVTQMAALIKSEYPVNGVLYGGSVSAKNITHYLAQTEIDGVVPGAASLDPKEFAEMIMAAAKL